MKSIIEEIYFGNRGSHESIKPGKEYHKARDKLFFKLEELKERLGADNKFIDELDDLICDVEGATELEHFKEGLKIGILLGLEVQ